ncbi:FUSC family protein [Myxosarcina sp. GI1]|uniref:FUSC family protein n=1 Tax=Myxosarcina sp. GI1 TaxID=1541065 RepID=UPI00155A8420|nr:FUSC family protein [Myxosarcina sp. GI1]
MSQNSSFQTGRGLEDLERSIEALEHQWQSVRDRIHQQTLKIQTSDYAELVNLRKIVTSLTKLSQQIHTDAEIATNLSFSSTPSNSFFLTQPQPSFWWDTIKNNFNFRSVSFRHALRLAAIVITAQLIAYVLPISRGYWITLTALVALKPNFGGTFQSTGQRVLGTIVGSIIGIVLVTQIHNSVAIASLVLLLMFGAMSLRSLSYSIFITLLTPVIILLLNVIGVGDWKIGILRIIDSLIGGGLALLGSYLLFPNWEKEQLPTQLEQTIQANLAYFQAVISIYLAKNNDGESSLQRSRHRAALENANAEAAAQRLFSEPRHIRGEIEPVMTLMLYIRSFFSSVTALSEHLAELSEENRFAHIEDLTEAIARVLDNLATALNRGEEPQPLPALDNYLAVIGDRLEKLHAARFLEMTAHSIAVTPTLRSIREQTPVATELNRIVRSVTIMHCTISRMREIEAKAR